MSYKSWLLTIGAILIIPSGVAYASPNQATMVTLESSSPQVRTGQEVTLFASIPQPLLKGEMLSIIDSTTNQVIAETSSGTTVSGIYETNQTGPQNFTAQLIDPSNAISVNWTDQGIGNNQGYANAQGQTVTLEAPMSVSLGSPVVVNAVPSGLANPVYQFWWAMQGGQWHQSGHYQSDPRYQFAPPKSGLVDVTVYARESSAPSNETPVQRAQYEAKADTLTVAVNSNSGQGNGGTTTSSAPGWVSLSTPNEVALGSPIVLTADAAGITQPVYQFWFWSPEGGWESSGHYSSSSTYTIAGSVLGQWDAVVYARPASAPSNETTSQRAEYEVTSPMTTVTVIQP